MASLPSIFCLEGPWEPSLEGSTSVRPYLQLLADMRFTDRLIHKTVATRGEFEYYAGKWPQKQYSRFSIGYLAFHGDRDCLFLGTGQISLDELGSLFEKRLTGKFVVFGSCGTLAAADESLIDFCKITGARAIFGYTKYIDWIESASFDLLLLRELATAVKNESYIKPIYNRMLSDHPQFVRGLGFRMATRSWASPAKVARDALK